MFAPASPSRAVGSWSTVVVASCLLAGCSLIPRKSPVTKEMAAARRLSNEALAAADRDDLSRAESLLETAVKSCPADVDSRRHYAEVLWKRGEKMQAVAQIKEALRLSPGDVPLSVAAGTMVLELGLLDDADSMAAQAVALAPRSANAWQLHGQVALARGRPEEALADFQRSLALEPDNKTVLLDTAEVYRRLNRPRRALSTLAVLEEQYGIDGPPSNVLALQGLAQEALGRPEDALDCYRRAMARGDLPEGLAARMAALEKPSETGGSTASEATPIVR